MSSKVACLAVFIFVALTLASAQSSEYFKVTTYTDDLCTTTDGGYYVESYPSGSCTNPLPVCTQSASLWVKGECLSSNPLLDTPDYLMRILYATDSCVGTYTSAWAGPREACFLTPYSSPVGTFRLTGCDTNPNVTFEYYAKSSVCGMPLAAANVETGISDDCTIVIGGSSKVVCPPAPPMDAPSSAPVSTPTDMNSPQSMTPESATAPQSNTPTMNNTPQSSTPTTTPGKKASDAAMTSIGLATTIAIAAMLVIV